MRIFVGLKTSPGISALCLELQKRLPPEVRLVHPEDLHLTLLPPWEVEESELELIKTKLENVAHKTHPFEIVLEGVEFRPDAGVIWIRCQASPELVQLKEKLSEAFYQKEERGFLPHITLAKVRGTQTFTPLQTSVSGTMTVNSIQLFESRENEEVKYGVVEWFNLEYIFTLFITSTIM